MQELSSVCVASEESDHHRPHPDSLKAASTCSVSDSYADSCLGGSSEGDDEPPLDQKHLNLIHEELEKLNIATDVINKMEVQLDAGRATFREIQATWSEKLKELSNKYGGAIQKARPYYEAKFQERKVREESQKAAIRFERATSLLGVAKQQVALTQDSLGRQTSVHPECLEVLNHHIQRVSEAECERAAAEDQHRCIAERMMQLAKDITRLEKENRSAIKKSRAYFEQRCEFTRVLEHQKAHILRLEAEVRQKKTDYTTSLRNLERISDSIHEQRSIGSGSGPVSARTEEKHGGPPPYQPTAPPPYDEFDEERYRIEEPDKEDANVLSLIGCADEESGVGEGEGRRSIGSGVILLAQQLIGGKDEARQAVFELGGSQTDVSYRTLPEGLPHSPSDSSEVSSLASFRASALLTDDDTLSGMLRSHSTLIKEIDGCTDRVQSMLRRSVSDAERESGVESSY